MNRLPSPSDPFDDGRPPQQIEQHLQRWQPRPPNIDVNAVLRAGRAPDADQNQAAAVGQGDAVAETIGANSLSVLPAPPSRTRGPLATIAVSWTCGAIAGALITCLWLLPGGVPRTAQAIPAQAIPAQTLPAQTLPAQTRPAQTVAPDARLPGSETDRPSRAIDDGRRLDAPVWSLDEWLVAAQLTRLGQGRLDGRSGMMAGHNDLRFVTPMHASLGMLPSADDRPTDIPGAAIDPVPSIGQSDRAKTHDRLLQELLGASRFPSP
jgi:hypothetical protein